MLGVAEREQVQSLLIVGDAFARPLGVRLLAENLVSDPTTPEHLMEIFDLGHLTRIGVCLDTCHAHAGGEELATIVDRVKAITGRIDLGHANDSKDTFDSGRDRHDNFGQGLIDPKLIIDVVRAAGAPVVVETPGGRDGQRADIELLRAGLAT